MRLRAALPVTRGVCRRVVASSSRRIGEQCSHCSALYRHRICLVCNKCVPQVIAVTSALYRKMAQLVFLLRKGPPARAVKQSEVPRAGDGVCISWRLVALHVFDALLGALSCSLSLLARFRAFERKAVDIDRGSVAEVRMARF